MKIVYKNLKLTVKMCEGCVIKLGTHARGNSFAVGTCTICKKAKPLKLVDTKLPEKESK